MRRSRSFVLAALVATAVTGVVAQPPGKGPGPQAGPAAAASGPAASAPGPGAGPRARWGSDYTPGWSMMTPQERNEHRARLRSMQSYDECVAYMAQHREQMAARAKEQGRRALGTPPRDPCAPLKR